MTDSPAFERDRISQIPLNKWGFVWSQFLAHPLISLCLLVFSLLQAACEAAMALLVAIILQEIGKGGGTAGMAPGAFSELPALLDGMDTEGRIVTVGVSVAVIALVRLLAIVGANRLSVVLKSTVARRSQDRVHAHLLAAPLDVIDKLDTGDVMATAVLHADRVGSIVTAVATFVPRIVTMSALLGLLLSISPETAAVMFSVLLFPMFVSRFLLKKLRGIASQRTVMAGITQQFMIETFGGLREIRAAAQESLRHDQFIDTMNRHQKMAVNANTIQVSVPSVTESIGLFGIGVILAIAAVILSDVSSTWLSEVLLGLFLLVRLLPAASAISGLRSRIADCTSAYETVRAFLINTENTVSDDGDEAFEGIGSGIVFENVSFAYEGGKRKALRSVNFSFPPLGVAAVVGGSGAGKSTILHILMRFRRAQSGRVMVGGKDILSIERSDWRRRIGLVAQDPFLFNTSIAANIALKCPEAGLEEIKKAAKLAEIHDFISGLEHGYDTVVGDRGVSLSGGQRQRLAIARALLADPALIILDEATSALDATTEAQLVGTMKKIAKDMLVIMVTHRLNTAKKADHLVVLEEGEVVGIGSPDELMEEGRCPAFQSLLDSEASSDGLSPSRPPGNF